MVSCGHLDVFDTNGITFIESGKSLKFDVVETIPPYVTSFIIFRNVLVTKLYHAGGDEFPLTVVDLTWKAISAAETEKILVGHGFPFLDAGGKPRVPPTPLVAAHLEGDLVGDIISEEVMVERA